MAILNQVISNLTVFSVMFALVYIKHKIFLLNNLKPESFSQISFHFPYDLLCYGNLLLLRSHFAQDTKYRSSIYSFISITALSNNKGPTHNFSYF